MDLLKLLGHLDLNKIAADMMTRIKIQPFDLYFVVDQQPGTGEYELLGMAYSAESAREIVGKPYDGQHVKVFKMEMGNAIRIMEGMGLIHNVRV